MKIILENVYENTDSDVQKLGQVRKTENRPITAGEDEKLMDKLKPISQNIVCGLCNGDVTTTEKDTNNIELPYCQTCSIFFIPCWSMINGKFVISFNFKTLREKLILPNVLKKATEQKQETASADKSEPTQTAPISEQDTTKSKQPSVREQIITMLLDRKGTVQIAEFLNNIDANEQNIHKALNKLIDQNIVRRPKRGHYRLKRGYDPRKHEPAS